MLQISLSPESGVPLVDQIVHAIRGQIEDRVLRPGARLAAIRQFAENHEVSRFTVVEAYDRLVAQGYVQSRRGSGFYVANRSLPASNPHPAPIASAAVDAAWLMRQALDAGAEGLRASAGWLPRSWLDEEGLRRQLRAMLRDEGSNLGDYGRPQGYLPLRQHLPFKLAELGIAVQPAQIVLTHGATQALDMAVHHFVRRGDAVLVDDPGYFSLFGLLRLHGARLIGVPWTPEGPDAAELERLAAEHKPKVYFTQSVLHNPTGACLSPANAYRILQCAARHDFHIVEDDTYCDLHPGITTRLAALDHLDRVVYISSFSKTLSGNLRVGFVAACPAITEALTNIKVLTSLATPEAAEDMVYRMLTEGHYRKYVERLRNRLGEASARTLRLADKVGLAPFIAPQGGVFIWTRIPGVDDAVALAARAAQQGIILAPGTLFRPQGQASPWLRLNVAYGGDVRLERFLGEALDAQG
ncbi:aminotransferase-like domain-containing protein [Uliginosibacterium aquaticum]|uniref:PLP-dependent aminotransferase family protein n=1 Tax=Uliginosibacterium aquaticum TaxID=2731212 RepID=A0ABX2IPI6_9RHOO|nr:PLP-dependent aminotransferase family protein [Uliginosibacterium aquaticum]NSL56168.1 PLP-dependent aminotransferase family protein [Uliginosibacterium aquaticum]